MLEFSDAALKELEEVYRQTSDFIKDALIVWKKQWYWKKHAVL